MGPRHDNPTGSLAVTRRSCVARLSLVLPCLAAFVLAVGGAAADQQAGDKPVPVIYDTDIGEDIDDTWALVYLLRSPELEPKLITTGFTLPMRKAKIAARVLERIGRTDVPVGAGVGRRDYNTNYRPWVDDFRVGEYEGTIHEDGVAKLIETVHADRTGRLKIVAVGPMQTLAEAIQRDPSIAPKAELIAMAGNFAHLGGDGKVRSESNVRCKIPEARKVFSADWKKIIVVPSETCGQVKLTDERYRHMLNSDDPGARTIIEVYRIWRKNVKWTNVNPDVESSHLYDTLAVRLAWGTEPVKLTPLRMRITDKGQTVVDEKEGDRVHVATSWRDAHALWAFENQLVRRITGSLPEHGVRLPVADVAASANEEQARKALIDGNRRRHGKAWSVETSKEPGWFQLELARPAEVRMVKIAFANGNVWTETFEIRTSTDGETWRTLLDTESGGKTRDFERFPVKPTNARYVRVVLKGHGTWHATPIGGARVYGLRAE